MQRERPNAAAAPRDRPVGVAVGTSVGRAVASEENCARFTESQGVIKEPDPLTTGLPHGYNSDFHPEDHTRIRGGGHQLDPGSAREGNQRSAFAWATAHLTSPTPASPHRQACNEGPAPTSTQRLALAAHIN